MKKIAIFASGNGTNAERIASYFSNGKLARVSLILTNNPEAGVLKRAERLAIPIVIFDRADFSRSDKIANLLLDNEIDLVVLAGFLWLVPSNILESYPDRIVNIHPAILPKYGGKGMFGTHVHEAVIASGDHKSGITVHFVNEKYDDGQIIFQSTVDVDPTETANTLAAKIHELEYVHFPLVIEKIIQKL